MMPPSAAIHDGAGVTSAGRRHAAARRIVLSGVSSDSHTWNLVFLQLFLEENGYEVANLGPCVPDDLLVSVATREQPDAIVISSVNGHGHRDGARAVRALRAAPLTRSIPVLIGGKLGIHGPSDLSYAEDLLAAGCDAVFGDESGTETMSAFLSRLGACCGSDRGGGR
jgi:methylaspartate mutase sigma subunit